jgi:hypothetical protein
MLPSCRFIENMSTYHIDAKARIDVVPERKPVLYGLPPTDTFADPLPGQLALFGEVEQAHRETLVCAGCAR